MGLTALAVHLHVGIPSEDSTQIADVAAAATGKGAIFAFFQLSSGLLLLAAAASSFQAGPGLLRALARGDQPLLPPGLARTNEHHTPVMAVLIYTMIAASIILIAGGQEQELVLVYAVAVFVSFIAGLLAMARFFHRRGARVLTATNLLGVAAAGFTLIVNLGRGYPLIAIGSAAIVTAALYWRWVRAGRPRGIEEIEREAEAEE
jgi:Amino acid permease